MREKIINQVKIVVLIGLVISIPLVSNSTSNQERNGINNPKSNQIDSPKTIDYTVNITESVIMELNLTYNATYEALSVGIFMLRFDITDLQGIYTDLEFKYIIINYDWLYLYSNLNGTYNEGANGDIFFGGGFSSDTVSIEDADVSYKLGVKLINGTVGYMLQITVDSTGMTVDVVGNLEPTVIEPEDDAIWILIFPMRYWYDWLILALVVTAFVLLMVFLDKRSKKKKAFKAAQEEERLIKEKEKAELL